MVANLEMGKAVPRPGSNFFSERDRDRDQKRLVPLMPRPIASVHEGVGER